jgi:peptidoglycan/xylan/chitin deacetylase (PgdA/CDA1 family)
MGRLYRNQPTFSAGYWLPTHARLRNGRAVALTFDDGPTPETTPRVLKILDRFQAPATFFLSGERVEKAPHLVGEIVAAGHEVYAHGYSHIRLQHEPPERLHAEMSRAEALLARYRPTPSPYFVRLPYGSGARDAAVHRAVRAWDGSAQLALWSHNLRDHLIAAEETGLEAIERRCEAEVERLVKRRLLGGGIILLHETPYNVDAPFNAETAPLLLERLLVRLAERGLRIDRLRPYENPSRLSRYVLTASV